MRPTPVLVLLLLGAVVPPLQALAAPATAYGDSFVDADDDGIFTPGTDVLLADVIGPDGAGFDVDDTYPNWTPRSSPVGVFLRGKLKFPEGLYVQADDVTLDGSITGYADEDISLNAGDELRLTDRSKITNVGLIDLSGRTLAELGERVKLVSKEYGFISVYSRTLTRTGEKVVFQTGNGADDPDVYLSSDGAIDVGSGFRFKGVGYAVFEIRVAQGDLVIDRFNFRGYTLYLYVSGQPGQAGRIAMSNSYIAAKGEDAFVVFWTKAAPDGTRPADAITLLNAKFSAPICEFEPPQPPIKGCIEQY